MTTYNYKSWKEYNNIDIFTLPMDNSWKEFMNTQKDIINNINEYLTMCIKEGKNIYPYPELVFNAFLLTPLNKVKVVILGQDPYHGTEKDYFTKQMIPQAMGLSFSVPKMIKIPSSLCNIFRNLHNNKLIDEIPTHGDLSEWANQGCLLFNSAFTVEHKNPNSHADIWSTFSDNCIKYISDNTVNTVFILWGKFALKKYELGLIDDKKHCVLASSHPSGLSYNNTMKSVKINKVYSSFKDSNNFKLTNDYLCKHKKEPINWNLL